MPRRRKTAPSPDAAPGGPVAAPAAEAEGMAAQAEAPPPKKRRARKCAPAAPTSAPAAQPDAQAEVQPTTPPEPATPTLIPDVVVWYGDIEEDPVAWQALRDELAWEQREIVRDSDMCCSQPWRCLRMPASRARCIIFHSHGRKIPRTLTGIPRK